MSSNLDRIGLMAALLLLVVGSAHAGDEEGRWLFGVDALSWQVYSPGVEYGISDIGGVQDRGAVGDVISLDAGFESGYRLSAGRRFGGGQELRVRFTSFDSQNSESRAGSIRSVFITADNAENNDSDDPVNDVTPDDRATNASAALDFDYSVIDIEVAQAFEVADALTLRLSGGLRSSSIDSRFDVTYTGGDFQTAFSPIQVTEYESEGLMLGSALDWRVSKNLKFTLAGAGGLMLGEIETRTFIPDDEPGVPTDVRFREDRIAPVMEMALGLDYRFSPGDWDLNFAVGYELTNWFNISESRVFTDAHMEAQNAHVINDLSLGGAYLSFTARR